MPFVGLLLVATLWSACVAQPVARPSTQPKKASITTRSYDRKGWKLSVPHAIPYVELCRKAATDDSTFATFKSKREYQYVLEHTDRNVAARWIEFLAHAHPYLLHAPYLKRFQQNDLHGGSTLYDFGAVETHGGRMVTIGSMSPSTVKYMGNLAQLIDYFGRAKMERAQFCEIGGGYGGMAHIVLSFARHARYQIFDLKEPTMLQSRYLRQLGWSSEQAVAGVLNGPAACDIVLSNVALTELEGKAQMEYARSLMETAKVGVHVSVNIIASSYMYPWLNMLARNRFDVAYAPMPVAFRAGHVTCAEVVARAGLAPANDSAQVRDLKDMHRCDSTREAARWYAWFNFTIGS